jgi:asparagine synthetase B (glutamine-hydrolysing)
MGHPALRRLNGQFAFALFDRTTQEVILVRDRFGVRPLFYAIQNGDLVFASEVKALFASGEVEPAADPEGLDEVFTFWGTLPPRTPFKGVINSRRGITRSGETASLRCIRGTDSAIRRRGRNPHRRSASSTRSCARGSPSGCAPMSRSVAI